jgi:hypothetical protein
MSSFNFLLTFVKINIGNITYKAFKEANWKQFMEELNENFLHVQWNWKQVWQVE